MAKKSSKLLKKGRIVIMLRGRYAGRKAIILDSNENGDQERRYPYCLVVGINRYPRKVHKRMSKKKILNRIKTKPFIKFVNLNHVMPTRFGAGSELELDKYIKLIEKQTTEEKHALDNADFRTSIRKEIKESLESKYSQLNLNHTDSRSLKLKFFFKRLKF